MGTGIPLAHLAGRRKWSALLVLILLLSYSPLCYSQKYTEQDASEIGYLARLTLKDYEDLLLLISQPLPETIINEAIYNSFQNPKTKFFYSEDILVESDIRPSELAYPVKKELKVGEYLHMLKEEYIKAQERTIFFSNFQLSELKYKDYLFVEVKFVSNFEGSHKEDTTSYKAAHRLAKIRAEKKDGQWYTYLMGVRFLDPQQHNHSERAEVVKGSTSTLENPFAEKLNRLLESAQDASALNEANQLAEQVSQQDSVYQFFMQKGKTVLEAENLQEALRAFNEAQLRNPYDLASQRYIVEINQLILSREKEEKASYQQALELVEKAKEERDYHAAKLYLEQALKIKPGETELLAELEDVEQAVKMESLLEEKIKKSDYRGAILEYTKALGERSTNPEYFYGRGSCYEKLGEASEAIQDYSRAIQLKPDYVMALNARALLYEQSGCLKEAIEDYSRIILLPEHAAAFYPKRAKLKKAVGDFPGAIADFDAAIIAKPEAALNYHEKGILFFEQNQYEKAIDWFTKAVELDSQFVDSYYFRGLAGVHLRETESASADFERARKIGLRPAQASAINEITASLIAQAAGDMQKEDYANALQNYTEATIIAPTNSVAWLGKGDGYFQLKKYTEALHNYEKALRLDSFSYAFYKRGLAYEQLENKEAAVQDFRKFIALGAGVVEKASAKGEALCYLGEAQWKTGRLNDALNSLNEASRFSKENPQLFYVRGVVYFELKDYRKAIRDVEESIRLGLLNKEALHALGAAYNANGQLFDAIATYSYVIDSLDSESASTFKRRAVCFKEVGEYELALKDIESILQLEEGAEKDVELLTSKGLLELYLKRYQQANASFESALLRRKDDPWALYGKACVLANQSRHEEALPMFQKAFETKKIFWSDIESHPFIAPVVESEAFKKLVKAYL